MPGRQRCSLSRSWPTVDGPLLAESWAQVVGVAEQADQGGIVITVLIVILVLMMLGSLPAWPHSSGWGYYPSGGLGLILLILIVLALSGRL